MINLIIVGLLASAAAFSGSNSRGAHAYDVTQIKNALITSECEAFSYFYGTMPNTIIGAQIEEENRRPAATRRPQYANPFYGRNYEQIDPAIYQKCPIRYETSYKTTAGKDEGKGKSVYLLRAHGLNYKANITVNGQLIASDRSAIGGIRRYAFDVTDALVFSPTAGSSFSSDRRAGGAINAIALKQHSKAETAASSDNSAVAAAGFDNKIRISVQAPENPRGNDFAFSFLDWNPLPADFNAGIWRSLSMLKLDRGLTVPSDSGDDTVFLWSNGLSVTTRLGREGKDTTLAEAVTIDIAVQCYPLATCERALISNPSPADAQAFIASRLLIRTNYPATADPRLAAIKGAESCRISAPFARVPSHGASAVEAEVFGPAFVEGRIECVVENVKNPLLWYPFRRAYNAETNTAKPHLFELDLFVVNINNGDEEELIVISEPKKRFGLRQVVSSLSPDNSRQLSVNGEFILIAGGGWSPDMYTRVDDGTGDFENSPEGYRGKLLRQLELTKHMGVNLIRLEGKWENELFFNLCDEMGIMVLAGIECCSSWQNWKLWDEQMTTIAKVSVRDQLRRLTSHASVVSFLTSSDEIAPESVERMYVGLYAEERLSAGVIPAACGGASKVSGPTGVKMSGPYSWVPPHYFLENSNGKAKALGGAWGFLSEGGPGEAPMTYNAWKLTAPEEHQWDPSTLTNANASLSPWWNAHAGNPKGKFATLVRFTEPLNARHGPAASAKEYLYKAQLMNYEGIRAMFEAYARNKIYNSTGVVQWMLNNAFPSNIWHLYDYYLIGGGGYYGAKAALRPLQMVFSYIDGSVALVSNDFSSHFGTKKGTAKRIVSAEWFVYRLPASRAEAHKAPKIIASSGAEEFDANLFGHNSVMFMNARVNLKAITAELGVNETFLVRLVYIVTKDHSDDPTFTAVAVPPSAVAVASASGLAAAAGSPPAMASSSFAASSAIAPKKMAKKRNKSKRYVEDNWYWLSTRPDVVDWDYKGPSPHLWTGCLQWADFTSLETSALSPTPVVADDKGTKALASPLRITYTKVGATADGDKLHYEFTVHNTATYLVFGVQLAAYESQYSLDKGTTYAEIAPSFWDDNYFMLMPNRTRTVRLTTLAFADYRRESSGNKIPVKIAKIEAVTYNDIIAEKALFAAQSGKVRRVE